MLAGADALHVQGPPVFIDSTERDSPEEFVILLANTEARKGADFAERIRVEMEKHPFVFEGTKIQVTASIGVSEYSPSVETYQDLIKLADKAMYSSKNSGRNRVTVSQ